MINNWEEIKWIFEPDGTLRDIYVENVDIEDWKILIEYLNANHIVKYGPSHDNEIINRIDKDYLIQLLTDKTDTCRRKISYSRFSEAHFEFFHRLTLGVSFAQNAKK